MTPIPELWSDVDRLHERRLVQAVVAEDLLGALTAIEGLDDDAAAGVRAWIDLRVERVRALRGGGSSALDAMIGALVQDAGIIGDAEDYYAPDNSRVSQVVARKTGQPILIASLWMLVGAAAGVVVHGLALPGHFVAAVDGSFVDVFKGGAVLTRAECEAIARRSTAGKEFDPAWLEPATTKAIVVRVLRNLAHAHERREEAAAVYRTVRLLGAVVPEAGPVQLELARLTELHGAWPEAVAMYRVIVERFADQREARIAELKLVELEHQTRTLN